VPIRLTVSQFCALWNGDAEKTKGSYLNYRLVPPSGTTDPPLNLSDMIASESPAAGSCDNSINASLHLGLP